MNSSGDPSLQKNSVTNFLKKLQQVFIPPRNISGGESHLWEVRRRNLDLHQISGRVNRSFFTSWDGPPPFTTLYLVPLILALGLVVGILWLYCACSYHTMQRLKSWCPSFKLKKRSNRPKGDPEDPSYLYTTKEMPTPEILEQRRQDRLRILQNECENLEQQLSDEKTTTLTSRASDSDLEYLGYGEETPPLKRNSISLQDIPQSVIKIRREKQLRQLKEEIEHLHALSQSQDLDKDPHPSKSPLLRDIKFEFHGSKSKSSTPSPVEVLVGEPLSQRISHLKAHRKLQEIRAELEGLAVHLVHSDDIRAKASSLQDLPTTALGAKRQKNIMNISKEIENIKNYKLQETTILKKVLPSPDKDRQKDKNEILAKLNREIAAKSFKKGNASPSKSPLLKRQESEMSEASSVKTSESNLAPTSSIKRTRQQELNRVRVELKELSYKLNLNYAFDDRGDREKIFPPDWPKQCSFSRENSVTK